MFLILNSIVASLDGLIIGIGLKLAHTKLSKTNILTISIGNIVIYTFFLTLYYYFKLTFMTKLISSCLYLFLAWRSYKEKENNTYTEKLSFLECILLTITHSLDGTLISLNFVYNYQLIYIISIFSFSSIILLLLGYYFAKLIKITKKSNYISACLFLLLAFTNQFF